MSTEITWQAYLHEIVRRRTAAEKLHLYNQVGVTRTTFLRWRGGENTPDAAHLYLLLHALPSEEAEPLRFLMAKDPKVLHLLPTESPLQEEKLTNKIPQEVYEKILRLGRDAPDRFWLLCSTILGQAVSHFETKPIRSGIEILVAKLMLPHDDGKIRSLRAYAGRGTPPWRDDLHMQNRFLGAESLAGYAVMKRHGIMVPDRNNSESVTPIHWMECEMSCAAYPILREGCIAGALIVSCCLPDFFTQEKLTLIEKYADLIRLAFYDEEFYPVSSIDLGLMPNWNVQKQYFSSFAQRVTEVYKSAMRDGQTFYELSQAETRVRGALEEELLHLASVSDEGITASRDPMTSVRGLSLDSKA